MTDLATVVAHRDKPALPQQWAEEIALATSAPTTASSEHATPPETLGGTVFDVQLDGFLDRFQQEIVTARALKDDFDRLPSDDPAYAAKKAHFKLKMDHIRALFATEGEDFVASLERRNPTLSMAACGENTLEFAQGIDRLESAVREEEARRAQTRAVHTPPSQVLPTAAARSPHAQPIVSNRPVSTPPSQLVPPPYAPMSAAAAAGSPPARTGFPSRLSATAAGMRATLDPYAPLRTSPDRVVAPPIPASGIGHALYNLSSDETLQLMQSDINALKLELMRMQRAKNGAPAPFVPYSLPSRGSGLPAPSAAMLQASHLGPVSADGSFTLSSLSPDKENENPAAQPGGAAAPGTPVTASAPTTGVPRKPSSSSVVSSTGVPASILANNNVNVVRVSGRATGSPPQYVNHLDMMKSRLAALEKKPLSRRAKSAVRLGRTHTMGSMYDHVPASAAMGAELRHTTTPGSAPDVEGESGFPAMLTPPRVGRRAKHRSLSTPQSGVTSPLRAPVHVSQAPSPPQSESFSPGSIASPPRARLGVQRPPLSPSPPPLPAKTANTRKLSQQQLIIAAGAGHGNSPNSTPSPNRDNTRNSGPSPAKLFFDAPEEMLSRPQSHAAARDIQRYSLKVARRLLPGGGGHSGSHQQPQGNVSPSLGAQEPRAKSAVAVSPSRQRALDSERMSRGMGQQHTLSDMGMGAGAAAATNGAVGGSTPVLGAGPPSTIETTGSGGRVVEEIEGDMWVRKGVVWKRWRRRYASIVSHQFFGKVMCLFSYNSGGGIINTRSQIVVLNQSLCRALRDKVEIGGAERYMFALRTSSKEYLFAAESDEVRRNWIRELRDAAKLENSGRPSHTTKGRSMAFRRKG